MFGRLFGTTKPKPQSQQQGQAQPNITKGIHDLRSTSQQLEKREQHLQMKVDKATETARQKSRNRDKKGALYELKKKKILEKQLQSIQGKRINIETQIMALEDAHLNVQALKAMKSSAKALKTTMSDSDLENAEDLMEDVNEAMDSIAEMNDAMAQPLGAVIDDDELEAELAELDDMEADQLLIGLDHNVPQKNSGQKNVDHIKMNDLPNVPQKKVVQSKEEEELQELEAMFN